jgi:hypothetical protein
VGLRLPRREMLFMFEKEMNNHSLGFLKEKSIVA